MKRVNTIFILLILALGYAGCETLEGINPFNSEKEVTGLVEAITDMALTVEGIEYTVTDQTTFDGINGLGDLSVGDEVEIEYTESGGTREAVEVDLAGTDNG